MIFDPPGSTSAVPSAFTAAGVVLGSYIDSSGAQRGFLRNADGSFTTFDPTGLHIPRKSGGRIIMIGSSVGERVLTPGPVAYSATKGAYASRV